jgi:hypothetical protein
MELEYWELWFARHYPTFRDKDLHLPSALTAVLRSAHGNPLVIANSCEAIVSYSARL